MAAFILGTLVGLIAGLLICYWQKVKSTIQNRDKISAVAGLADSISNVGNAF